MLLLLQRERVVAFRNFMEECNLQFVYRLLHRVAHSVVTTTRRMADMPLRLRYMKDSSTWT